MINVRRYTTPTIIIKVKGANLAGLKTFVTFKQGRNILFTREDLSFVANDDGSQTAVVLTQEETGQFNTSERVKIQVRYINQDGTAGATSIKSVDIRPVLMEGVIQYA